MSRCCRRRFLLLDVFQGWTGHLADLNVSDLKLHLLSKATETPVILTPWRCSRPQQVQRVSSEDTGEQSQSGPPNHRSLLPDHTPLWLPSDAAVLYALLFAPFLSLLAGWIPHAKVQR